MLGAVADILRVRGTEGWLVGGSVRDRMLGRFSPDLDVVVDDDAAAVAEQVAGTLHSPWFALSERYPTYRVLGSDGHVDVAAVRGGGILADLALRDFTVNAMAVPLTSVVPAGTERDAPTGSPDDALLDPFAGAKHLSQGRLVAVSERVFTDDPLRLMRASRFAHVLGLTMGDDLTNEIRARAQELSTAAVERVVSEMCLTLGGGRSADALRLWDGLGLLDEVLPEVRVAGGGSITGLSRVLSTLEHLDEILGRPEDYFPAQGSFWRERSETPVDGAVDRQVALRLAGVLQAVGAEAVRSTGRRLRLSGALISLLTAVARSVDQRPDVAAPQRATVLFLWNAAPWEPEVVLLTFARDQAEGPVGAGGGEAPLGAAQRLMTLAARRAHGELAPCPVDGEMLMRELGLQGGPALGRALREVRLAWESDEATSAGELLEVARAVVS